MKRRVVFAPEAASDLIALYDYIAEQSGGLRAIKFIEQIEVYCRGFSVAGERGTPRGDIRPGLRIVGYRRRVTNRFPRGWPFRHDRPNSLCRPKRPENTGVKRSASAQRTELLRRVHHACGMGEARGLG